MGLMITMRWMHSVTWDVLKNMQNMFEQSQYISLVSSTYIDDIV